MLKVLIFDIDGVLLNIRTGDEAAYKLNIVKAGYPTPDMKDIEAVLHLPFWEGIKRILKTDDASEVTRVANIMLAPGVSPKDLMRSPDNLFPILASLAQDYRLAIATSRFKQGLNDFFAFQDIAHLFDAIISWEDTEHHKPHPEPLLTVLDRLDVSAAEAVYIGDLDSDAETARAAGMRSIQISSLRAPIATIWIQKFDDIPQAVAQLILNAQV